MGRALPERRCHFSSAVALENTEMDQMNDERIVHVIDDDPAILTSVAGFLVTNGFGVQTYASGYDFLEAIGSHAAGCVVTDVRMPGISGTELMSKLKERGLALPIIIITGYPDISLTVEAVKHGAVDLLEKPFNNGSLVKAIRKALTNWNEETPVGPNTEDSSCQALDFDGRGEGSAGPIAQGYAQQSWCG